MPAPLYGLTAMTSARNCMPKDEDTLILFAAQAARAIANALSHWGNSRLSTTYRSPKKHLAYSPTPYPGVWNTLILLHGRGSPSP